tara:strand:+ start:168 stop:497 length:330 start_codon:yes stop_codon:yes gene_type:complete
MINTCACDLLKGNDYKSIALPAELQGHKVICRIFSLISQLNQSIINKDLARCFVKQLAIIAACTPIVTNLSVLSRCVNLIQNQISNACFFILKVTKTMEWKNEDKSQIN